MPTKIYFFEETKKYRKGLFYNMDSIMKYFIIFKILNQFL